MKRFCIILIMLVGLLIPGAVLAGQASAVDVISGCTSNPNLVGSAVCQDFRTGNGATQNPVISVVKIAIQILALIIGIAAIVGIVVSGLKMITSGGDSSSVASARSGLVYSLIGLAVAILSQIIVVYILDKLNL